MCGMRFQLFAGQPTTVTGGGSEETAVACRVAFSRQPPKNIPTVSATPFATTNVGGDGEDGRPSLAERGGVVLGRPSSPRFRSPVFPRRTRSVALHRGVREETGETRAGRPSPPPRRVNAIEEVGWLEEDAM